MTFCSVPVDAHRSAPAFSPSSSLVAIRRWRATLGLLLLVALGAVLNRECEAQTPASPSTNSAAQGNAATPKPVRALLICGGCCHDYDSQKNLLAKGLAERAWIDVTVVHQGGSATNAKIPFYERADWAQGYDVVLHDECFADVKDRAWTDRILKPHREGLPAVVIHCAMHCYRDGSDEWFKFLGVTSRTHGKHYPHEVLNVDGAHPIMKSFGPAWYNPAGELYWIEKLWPTAKPLAVAKNQENGRSEVCVWTNDYGSTRVFGTTLGHHNETVSSPAYLDLVARGTLWACGKLDDSYLKTPQPRQVPVNLARGKSAKASSEEKPKNNLARLAVDGNPATRWCASDGSLNQWLEIDLGAVQLVKGCRLDWEGRDAIYRYRVEGSEDGKTWKLLADGEQNKQPGPSEPQFAARLRHLKVTYLGCDKQLWGSLWEVQVFGDKTTTEVPLDVRLEKEKVLLPEVKVPEGFSATVFAAPPAVTYPVFVAAAPEGTVYVSSDGNGSLGRDPHRGRVLRLRDLDRDGRADEVKLFVSDIDSPRGLVWDQDRLYLLHPPHLSAFVDANGDGVSDEQRVLVKNIAFDLKQRPADHTSNGVTLGIDGWLYMAIGDFGFMEAEGTDGRKLQLRGGGVARVRTDGTGLELVTRGTRNILEVSVDPQLNGFARDNTNDGGGWDIRLHHFTGLDHHGYPSLFRNFPEDARTPLDIYGGGSGCGGLYLDEPGFPEGYGNALYTADWGRQWVYRHRMAAKGATFTADQAEFVSVTRVTDLDVDASSRLYVASWKGATFNYAGEEVGYLVQVAPAGYQAETLPDFDRLATAELVAQLASPSHRRRLAAQRVLVRKGLDEAAAKEVFSLAVDSKRSLNVRVAALFTLKQTLGAASHPQLVQLAADPAVREHVLKALTDRLDQLSGVPANLLAEATRDSLPRVRRQAAESIARLGNRELAAAVVPLLVDSDPIVAHSSLYALIALQADQACLAALDDTNLPAAARDGAMRVLGQIPKKSVVESLAAKLAQQPDAARRMAIETALCRLYLREGEWKGDSWGTRPDTTGPNYQGETWEGSEPAVAALRGAFAKADGDEAKHLVRQLARHRVAMDGVSELLLRLAESNPAVVPAAVEQLARESTPPAQAVKLLTSVVKDAKASAAIRSQCVIALAKLDSLDALAGAWEGLRGLANDSQATAEFDAARQAWLASPHLARHVDTLSKWSSSGDNDQAIGADAALTAIVVGASGSAEARLAAQQTLERGNDQPARRERLIEAVRWARQTGFRAQVLAMLTDKDPKVASAARRTAEELKFLVNSSVKPSGPAVGKLPVEEVVAKVVEMKGDPALGEELFGRLGCAKCHTVKTGEPPRGPFLGTIANTYKRKELAESILLPSKSLAQGFVTQVFALNDGRTVTGFVVQEGAERVILRNVDAQEIVLKPADIDERVKQTISLMPEGLAKEITLPELASLLDYLESLPKKQGGK
jgi:putative membrane-bound dehydrogenase-like protein